MVLDAPQKKLKSTTTEKPLNDKCGRAAIKVSEKLSEKILITFGNKNVSKTLSERVMI